MRRIIERKVTVVTTTTWTITWQDGPPQPSPKDDPVRPANFYIDDVSAPITPDPSTLIELKEADSEGAHSSNETKPSIAVDSQPSIPERK